MIPMQTRISEPLLLFLIKAFTPFLNILICRCNCVAYLSVLNYITVSCCFGLQAELAQHLLHDCLLRGISGTYLNPYYFSELALKEASLPWWTSLEVLSQWILSLLCIHPIFTVITQSLISPLWGFEPYITTHWMLSVCHL